MATEESPVQVHTSTAQQLRKMREFAIAGIEPKIPVTSSIRTSYTFELRLPNLLDFLNADQWRRNMWRRTGLRGDCWPVGSGTRVSWPGWAVSARRDLRYGGSKACTKLSMKVKIIGMTLMQNFRFGFSFTPRTLMKHYARTSWILLFREMGVPPQSVHARLVVNGEFVGYSPNGANRWKVHRHNFEDGGNLFKEVWPLRQMKPRSYEFYEGLKQTRTKN